MREHRRGKGCLWILLLLGAVVTGLWWLVNQSPVKQAARVAPEIATFVGQPDLAVRKLGQRKTMFGDIKLYSTTLDNGDSVLFDVDENGAVVGFFRQGQTSTSVLVSLEKALQIAISFAKQHNAPDTLLALPPETAELVEGEDRYKYYRFVWVKEDELSGAYLPQSVQVVVNAQTGQVDSYNHLQVPVTVRTQPDIAAHLAEQTALETMEEYLSIPVVVETKLIVTTIPLFEPDGTQALLWQVLIQGSPDEIGYVPKAAVFVDALSGELVHIEPFR